MATKKKKKYGPIVCRLEAKAVKRTNVFMKDAKQRKIEDPQAIGYRPFSHPRPNSADWDAIYLRGNK